MGILDIGARALMTFQADTSDLKSKLKELQGEEKQLAKAQLEAAEARNKQMEDWKGGLEKAVVGLAGVGIAVKVMVDGYKDGINDMRNANAALGISIDKLKEASHGLVTENSLLEFAAKANTAAFKNSQSDMENAQRAMYALTQQGRDQKEVTDKVTEALLTLRTRGLQELGIYVDTSRVKLDANGEVVDDYNNKLLLHQKILDALSKKGAEFSDSEDQAGDAVQRSAINMQNALDDLRKALGQFVVAMRPLIDVLAESAKGWALLVDGASKLPGWVGDKLYDLTHDKSAESNRAYLDYSARLKKAEGKAGDLGVLPVGIIAEAEDYDPKLYAQLLSYQKAALALKESRASNPPPDSRTLVGIVDGPSASGPGVNSQKIYNTMDVLDKWLKDHDPNKPLSADARYALAVELREAVDRQFRPVIDRANAQDDWSHKKTSLLGVAAGETNLIGQNEEMDSAIAKLRGQGDAYNSMMANAGKAYDAWNHKVTNSLLEKTFGPVGEFDLYKKGFEALSGAVGSAYDAWVNGSESAGAAFKKFIGQAVEAVGKQMAIEAIKEGAYALGSLAFGDVAGASAHGAAAAEFAAGAVIAGVVAHEMGTGGSSAAAGTSGGKGASGSQGGSAGNSGSGQVQHQSLIVVGEMFNDDTPRMRQNKARRWVQLANGNGGYDDN